MRTLYKLLPISKELFGNILDNFHFITLLVSCEISSKMLNLLFLAVSAHSLYRRLRFFISVQFSSFRSLSRAWLFVTPWIAARQASLSIINSRSSLKLTSVFCIDGTKNAKASFLSLKEYKVFYTKFHCAQQNELYALI